MGLVTRQKSRPNRKFLITCAHVLDNKATGNDGSVYIEGGLKVAEFVGADYWRKNTYDPTDVAIAEVIEGAATVSGAIDEIGGVTGISKFTGNHLPVFARGKSDPVFRTGIIKSSDSNKITVRETQGGAERTAGREGGAQQFGNAGDSGSVVINRFGRAIGMISNRMTSDYLAFVIPIDLVMTYAAKRAGLTLRDLELVKDDRQLDLLGRI